MRLQKKKKKSPPQPTGNHGGEAEEAMGDGDGTHGFLLPSLLFLSLLFNLYFSSHLLPNPLDQQQHHQDWTQKAADEARSVATIQCSGHGSVFVDGILGDGAPVCECHNCYGGPDCSDFIQDCPADVNGGDPLFLEPYWKRHAAASAVVISGWHRMSYQANEEHFLSAELERHIRLLHAHAGNAVTEGRFIVFGVGSSQLVNAAVHALSLENTTAPSKVVASVPYYAFYQAQIEFFNSKDYRWVGDTSNWVNDSTSSAANLIEFVTSPNNPDGLLKKPVLNSSLVIYDHAYYWPHYNAISAPADGDVMLFTMSKVSGHAGSRFGWAIIKNESIFNRVALYEDMSNFGVSRETQLRMLKLIKAILAEKRGEEGDVFKFGYEKLRKRWSKLKEILSSTNRFSLQPVDPEYCTYYKKIRDPTPAYAWLKCEVLEGDEDCYGVFNAAGIVTRQGTLFGASKHFLRISMLKSDDDFEQFLGRLEALVSTEGAKII